MAKCLYTIVSYAQVVIEDPGSMHINVQHWLSHAKFFDAHDLSFAQRLFELEGIKCKLKVYYNYELLDSCSQVCFRAAAYTENEAKLLLHQMIPSRYVSSLKNPKFSDDARKVIAKYESDQALFV